MRTCSSLGAGTVISKIKTALGQVTTDRSSLGPLSRLQRINEHLSLLGENLARRESEKDIRWRRKVLVWPNRSLFNPRWIWLIRLAL